MVASFFDTLNELSIKKEIKNQEHLITLNYLFIINKYIRITFIFVGYTVKRINLNFFK